MSYHFNPVPFPKLELDKRRFRVKLCPCGKNNRDGKFVPYIGFENKGYCHACGETFLPERQKSEQWNNPKPVKPKPSTVVPVSFIPIEVFKGSLQAHEKNHFVNFLIGRFGLEAASELVSRYFIGTSKHWEGATVFWQVDINGKIRAGKIMVYDPTTGKRVKEPRNLINWVHKAIKLPQFALKQCLFAEHLLRDKTKIVAVFESEKTAIIASLYFPQFICVAVGSLSNLKAENLSALKGRKVVLFPDLNGFEQWGEKAKELSQFARVTVSDLLERKATEAERKKGLDLADYLLRFDYREFATAEPKRDLSKNDKSDIEQPEKPIVNPEPVYHFVKAVEPISWANDIEQLETYFAAVEKPAGHFKLNQYSTITNISHFIESHLSTVKANDGNKTFLPYLNRLQELKKELTQKCI